MNIQIFGKPKCFDTKKAERYFKERGIRFQRIDLDKSGISKGVAEQVRVILPPWPTQVVSAAPPEAAGSNQL